MDADRELAIASHTPPEAKGLFGDALETVLPGSGTPASDGQSDIVDPASVVEVAELLPSDSLAAGGDVEGALSASDKLERNRKRGGLHFYEEGAAPFSFRRNQRSKAPPFTCTATEIVEPAVCFGHTLSRIAVEAVT